ncbi:nuclease PIN [Salmonella enterica]|nr:nuclease PIN [Salmonella enterica]
MNRTTTGLCLAALLVSSCMHSVLRADEFTMRNNFFIADESTHQWANEQSGRTGLVLIRGTLLLSPCILESGEVGLPLPKQTDGIQERYALRLNLVGCGDGGSVTTRHSPIEQNNIRVIQSALLTGVGDGVLHPGQRMIGREKTVLRGGNNQITYYLSAAQLQALSDAQVSDRSQGKTYINQRNHSAMLRLRLDYE